MEVLGIKLPLREVTEAKRRYILYYAPYYKSVQLLAKALGFSRTLIYRHIKTPHDILLLEDTIATKVKEESHPEVMPLEKYAETLLHEGRIPIDSTEVKKIRKKFKNKEVDIETKRVSKSVTPSGKSVTVKKRNTSAKVLHDEKTDIALWVMEMYEQGVAVRQACLNAGITPKKFYTWLDEGHPDYSAVVTKIYLEAKKKVRRMLQDELITFAQNSLLQMVQDRELTRTTKYGQIDDKNQLTVKSVIQTTYTREASFSAVLRVLAGLGKAIGQTHDDAEKGINTEYSLMTEEELDKYIEEEERKLQEALEEQDRILQNEHTASKNIKGGPSQK